MKPRYFILVTSPTLPLAWITGAIFSYFSAEQASKECQVILSDTPYLLRACLRLQKREKQCLLCRLTLHPILNLRSVSVAVKDHKEN